jgi:hypothetical protein
MKFLLTFQFYYDHGKRKISRQTKKKLFLSTKIREKKKCCHLTLMNVEIKIQQMQSLKCQKRDEKNKSLNRQTTTTENVKVV